MATAAYDSVKMVRAAIGAKRLRAEARRPGWRGERTGAGRPSAASLAAEILRGVGASVVIAFGYVAFVTGLRWLLSLA